MALIERRTFLRQSATAVTATLAGGAAVAQTSAPEAKPQAAPPPGAAPKVIPAEPVTRILARYAATASRASSPSIMRLRSRW